MRILIDLQHPAHLHFFRNAAARLRGEGHEVHFTGRDKDILIQLAREYGIDVEVFGVCRKGLVNMATEMAQRQWRLLRVIRRFKPDCMMAIAGTYIASVGRLLGVPTYVFYDTEHATISNLLSYPFATCVYVPRCYFSPIRWRHERYDGYHELAYLHPKYFTPDPSVLDEVGVKPGEIFTIVRFVGWGAVHDVGRTGFTHADKTRAVRELQRFGRVFVSCEGSMPAELEDCRLQLDVSRIHHLMAYAALIFGESGTMSSEGAALGVPAIFVSPLRAGTLEEQEHRYGIVFNFRTDRTDDALQKAKQVLGEHDRGHWHAIRDRILDEKIDVTDMLVRIALERPYTATTG